MRSSRLRSLLLGLLTLLAACQPLPQPFQPGDTVKSANPLIQPQDGYGVLVEPVRGMPDASSDALAREMAAALVLRELPAFTGLASPGSYHLSGRAVAFEHGETEALMRLTWELRDPDDVLVGKTTVTATAPRAAWDEGRPVLMRDLVARSAGDIAALLQPPAPVDRTTTVAKRSLFVWPIDGAPRPAGELLEEELESALQARSFRVASGMKDESVVIAGTVTMTPADGGKRALAIEWTVLRPDGGELGRLKQANTVTPESLEKDWPTIARAIAAATASGVKDLLDNLPEGALD